MASTTMNALVTELSKQVDDWFEGVADTNLTNPTYTLVDTALAEKLADWVSTGASGEQPTTIYIKTDAGGASAAPEGEERRVAGDITVSTGTVLTSSVYPFSAGISAGDTYEIHRKWTRKEKEEAIIHGCKVSFPAVYKEIQDRSLVFGDWLINGGNFPAWSQTTYPDNWTLATATVSKNTTKQYLMSLPTEYSIKFAATGDAGSLYQSVAENNDLWMLAGNNVTFYAWAYCSGVNEVRLSIYDGTTTTYSDYHTGGSGMELLSVNATIASSPSTVKFSILYDTSTADAYVGKVHVIGSDKHSYDITGMGLFNDKPTQIYRLVGADVSDTTPLPNPSRIRIDSWILEPNGKIHFSDCYMNGIRLEVIGMGHLTTPVSTYGGVTAVSTEIDNIYKEGQIVIAEAAKRLCFKRMHSCPSQDINRWKELLAYWDVECKQRRYKYTMKAIDPIR